MVTTVESTAVNSSSNEKDKKDVGELMKLEGDPPNNNELSSSNLAQVYQQKVQEGRDALERSQQEVGELQALCKEYKKRLEKVAN